MLLRSCRTSITRMVALCATLSFTVMVLGAGIAAACGGFDDGGGGGGGGGGCPAPSVSTGGYDSLTSNSVTLTGSVNPQGCQTYYAFEYGRSSEGYPDEIIGSAGSGTSSVPVSTSSAIVQPSTSYHYRLSAWNSGGEVTGGSGSFTTPAACTKPTVTTEAASLVNSSTARLNGRINPNGCTTSYTFEYGLAGSGTYTKVTGSAGSGTGPISVWKDVSSLQSGKTYTFRLSASNTKGNSDGSFLYFTTALDPILFVHGWESDANTWSYMVDWFNANGWPWSRLQTFSYDTNQSNATTAQWVSYHVDKLRQETGAQKVDIITHSMGGLSSRYYLKNRGGTSMVEDWVSLAGPNHGTDSIVFCIYVACEEMKTNSSFLQGLNAGDETPGSVRYATWKSNCDYVVEPPQSVELIGADNRWSSCLLHTEIHKDYPTFLEVRDFVK